MLSRRAALCGTPGLMVARFPHSWQNQRGENVAGVREAILCSSCNRSAPAAAELLALFAVDERFTPGNVSMFAELAATWSASVAAEMPDERAAAADMERWRLGDL